MTISSRTPEGQPNQCPYCSASVFIEPSQPFGDAPCPACGQLLWFTKHRDGAIFYDSATANSMKVDLRLFIAQQLGVRLEQVSVDLSDLDVKELAGDSLDAIELAMELESEFDIYSG